jgi:hypothetical protein
MATDFLTAETRHQPNDQRADHRYHHRSDAKRGMADLQIGQGEGAEIGQVGDQADELQQDQAGDQATGADWHRDR